jgi:RNA polymerase sigma factor (TIGR02999 family)
VLVKLYTSESDGWRDERHFRAVAAMAMRQILIDRARRKATLKHGSNGQHLSLTGIGETDDPIDALALAAALVSLEASRPRAARVVELRLFGGLDLQEVADEIGLSLSTVKREWRVGQAWLRTRLADS